MGHIIIVFLIVMFHIGVNLYMEEQRESNLIMILLSYRTLISICRYVIYMNKMTLICILDEKCL